MKIQFPLEGAQNPITLATDRKGNLYVGDIGTHGVNEVDTFDAPSFSFTATPAGSAGSNNAKYLEVMNSGNMPLQFPVPKSGTNPSIAPNFTLENEALDGCPVVSTRSRASGMLQPEQSCLLSISFTPQSVGTVEGTLTFTDNELGATAPNLAQQAIVLSGIATQFVPKITWAAPAEIVYGTALSGKQLNAAAQSGTVSVAGTYAYSPDLGTVLGAGTHTLSVTFTPSNKAEFTTATATVTQTVGKATLRFKANNRISVFGHALPALTYTVSGFVNGDSSSVLTGTPSLATTATPKSPVGNYQISIAQNTLAATNYTFAFLDGTLEITPIGTAAAPKISPAGGTYSTAQTVTLTDATPGAVIYFTTDGTSPTSASTKYMGGISVSESETIKAIAVAPGYTKSVVATAAYVIE
ncbi:MAG: chitobiase/beta-hexosaminidase C-terminal domain-containing protein [Terracidiphilus sp.]